MTRALLLVCLWLALAVPAQATEELEALLAQGQLSIASEMQSGELLVPGQRARLVIEIATSTWFTGGTRIQIPEVPGLVIMQNEQFAANASESRQGQTWVIQRWSLDVFPQRAGAFTIPPIALSLQVNGGERGNLQGQISAPAVNFTVAIPAPLEQAEFWVAAPLFSVEQHLDRDTDTLQPGDAFERSIEFTGDDVLAMMLPAFDEERQPGLAAYPAPPVLENRNNRGQTSASRVQTISYVAEKPGNYLLPAQEFFWWNTAAQELSVLSIPAIEVHVAGELPVQSGAAAVNRVKRDALVSAIIVAVVAVLLALLLLRYRPWKRLSALAEPIQTFRERLAALRRPALPQRLNPDSSAGD